ncbi:MULTISPECIES: ATP-dependent RNA helicase HrpA [Pseudomonas]|uniref:RNA helicase n=1 Tax=Pseudomonas putida TaxID=303 RepID=A0A9X8ELC6_PSEPU|nr:MULTISPECIES: ATP-dependent RNA helicase HrpA [Pseudomonas]MCP8349075.1 ATP-dependent RNA helicase HrpA [Pseudomonas sp. FBF18]MCQ0166106.1 ATP-dependent RNA helicase HrpA [Pseudomonas sp. S12(2018)]MDD1954193.1 ATP-dependent RNA helicase HrpA [Pseudomonas sp. 8209]MEC6742406.1 ATP-dependent RNA helicase HrpA [Pseudomonas qingdaonensis]OUM30343.1 ATP-dependent RNA helicase HrpA [Pseudomonas sp. 1239]
MTDQNAAIEQLLKNLDHAMIAERHRLRRQLHDLRKRPDEAKLAQWAARVQASCDQVAARKASVPRIHYDDSLPIAAKRDEIKKVLAAHQVLIIAGETGSGKTTQLPKICLELGRGQHGQIAHTQPRRIAARSVATRVAEELGTPLGALVGYQVRFEDQSDANTLVKLMTDGILLAETQHDRFLERYDTIIVDEAHERSLNIDFLLGYLKTLLPRRPDLKVIITSATIDLERFSRHFNDAPIIEVSGRTYPVETWYRPLTSEQDEEGNRVEDDLTVDQAILATLDEIAAHERSIGKGPGDVLVFLPGEREIRDAAEMLRKAQLRHTEILPLYARLSPAEQQKIFQSHPGRRVVLATNVAETSLTVPGIRYVIDSGTARISRYSYRAKVQRLPIEAVSQASANQRKGRCGRVEPGICVRLYSEDDFNGRPAFTDPEILRTNLAAVILQMLHLRLGEIDAFPFIEPPDGKAISDGFNLLQELSAVNRENQLTPLGRQLARLPVDPRLGRMLLEGAKQGSLQELLIVASALSVQDPRERPPERQQAADQAHAQWKDSDSDFAALVNLWRGFEEQRQALTASPLRNWCRKNFLNYLRLREWRDAHRQLSLICRDLQLSINKEPADYPRLHKAILSGLLSQIGQKTEDGDYLGARQRRFWVHPSSGLGKKRPQWLMTAELVETTKLYARMVAKIEPDWIEPLAGHLIKKNHFEPHWEKKRGQVVAFEQVTLYGMIVVGRRPVHYGPIDPQASRELFIRQALVGGEIQSRAKCLAANTRLLEQLDELEAKARRRDILADEETLYAYYEARLPAEIHQTATFDSWYRVTSQKDPQLLIMREEDVLAREASEVTATQYPDTLRIGDLSLALSYHFEPNHPRDGVTVRVPAPLLPSLPGERLEWLVPGLLEAKCIALVRNLPKALRKNFVPVPDFVKAALQRMTFADGSLPQALGRELLRMTGARVSDEAWAEAAAQVEGHLRMNIEVVDAQGKFLGEGRDLTELTARFVAASQAALAVPQSAKAQQPVQAKVFAEVAQTAQQKIAGLSMTVYPALVEEGGTVKEGRFSTQAEAEFQHRRALQRLLLQQLAEPAKFLRGKLPGLTELGLLYRELGRVDALVEDILLASLDTCILDGESSLPRDGAGLASLAERKRGHWADHAERLARLTLEILKLWHGLQKRFKGKIDLAQAVALNDIKQQLANLVYPGFVRETPGIWLKELPRYLKAVELRLEKLGSQVQKDRVWSGELSGLWAQYKARADKHAQEGKRDEQLVLYRWWIEEYRVSLFAQQLGTKVPISDKRLAKQWSLVEA